MFLKVFIVVASISILKIDGRTLVLSEKEMKQISSALKEALDRHHIATNKDVPFAGSFDCIALDDCELNIDINTNNSEQGHLSGNDVLNGLANGNGNDNGNNGNNNGNVIFQIFNAPLDESLIRTTEKATTTEPIYSTTTSNIWWPTTYTTTYTSEWWTTGTPEN